MGSRTKREEHSQLRKRIPGTVRSFGLARSRRQVTTTHDANFTVAHNI